MEVWLEHGGLLEEALALLSRVESVGGSTDEAEMTSVMQHGDS